jgi:hypothetical protein
MALTKVIGDGLGKSGLPTGTVIQMIHVGNNTAASSNNATYVLYLTAAITPQFSDSKIILQHTVSYGGNSNAYGAGKVTRTIAGGTETSLRYGNAHFTDSRFTAASFPMFTITNGNYKIYNVNFSFQEALSTTAEVTYKCYVIEDGAPTDMTINRSYSDPGGGYNAPSGSTIMLTEVAG